MTDTDEKLEHAIQEYVKRYPEAESPRALLWNYGEERLLRILTEAEGREIVFEDTEGLDEIKWVYR